MKKYIALIILGITIVSITLQSCKKENSIEPDPNSTITAKYNNDIKDIMNNYCITCHSGTAPAANMSLTTYTEVKSAAQNNGLYNRMTSSSSPMPASGKLSSDKLDKINAWIQDGYREN